MKTYIMHYTRLNDRKTHILNELNKSGINDFTIVEDFDKETICEKDYQKFCRNLRTGEISLIKKHMKAWNYIALSEQLSLVLEDDAILCDSFSSKLNNYIKQLPEHFDMVFLGDGGNYHIPDEIIKKSNTNVFYKENCSTDWGGDGATRCTDSYLITPQCAERILEFSKDTFISLPCDWWLNEVIRKLSLVIYWVEPTIVSQGSHTGKFECSC